MKDSLTLERVEICDFRGFPGPDAQALKLNGQHLLLYGENGSGKTTIFQAIAQLLQLSPDAPPFDNDLSNPRCLKNRSTDETLTAGHITLGFHNGRDETATPEDLTWQINTDRPRTHPLFVPMARTRGCLDYRAVLRTSFLHESEQGINLFSLLVETLLREIEMPTSGATSPPTFGAEWEALVEEGVDYLRESVKNPSDMDDFALQGYGFEPLQDLEDGEDEEQVEQSKEDFWREYISARSEKLEQRIRNFNRAFSSRITEIETIANIFIKKFDPSLQIFLDYRRVLSEPTIDTVVTWTKLPRLWLKAIYDGNRLDHPALVLNEARLTAIALAIYLAALKVETPDSAGKATPFPRLLILDDVLIGLDMANRLPVLDLIEQEFAGDGWQVFLMTFDRAWYELAKQRVPNSKWKFAELYAMRTGDFEKPILLEDKDHLDRALSFLAQGQVKAAAVHVRTEFELILKDACERLRIPIRYRSDHTKIPASELWGALKSAQFELEPAPGYLVCGNGRIIQKQPKKRNVSYVPQALVKQIEQTVSWVLNPLVHSQTVASYRTEIENAVFAVEQLRLLVHRVTRDDYHDICRQVELLLRIIKYREEEQIKGGGGVKERH
jgi:energy-coupling factor transporter ATP-binding protein EcfA2